MKFVQIIFRILKGIYLYNGGKYIKKVGKKLSKPSNDKQKK